MGDQIVRSNRPSGSDQTLTVLSSDAVASFVPAPSTPTRLIVAVCTPVSIRNTGRWSRASLHRLIERRALRAVDRVLVAARVGQPLLQRQRLLAARTCARHRPEARHKYRRANAIAKSKARPIAIPTRIAVCAFGRFEGGFCGGVTSHPHSVL